MHLERLALILEIVGQKGQATVADIVAHSDIPRPTAYRLVHDLTDAGLLDPVGKGTFSVGSRLKRITEPDLSDPALIDASAPLLRQAADTNGAAYFLSRLRGNAVEIIHVEIPDTGVSYLHPGLGKRPLHACSCSKAIAAFSPGVAEHMAGRLKAYTEFTLTDPDDLDAEFATIRRQGYAECVEELERGMCSVAVPLGSSALASTISVGATGPVRIFDAAFRRKVGRELLTVAAELVDRLGWNHPDLAQASA